MDESHHIVRYGDQDSDIETSRKKNSRHVLVIGAKNKPDALDLALWRYGFFDHDIFVDVPHEKAREDILSVLTSGLILEGSYDLKKVAKCAPGF